MTLPEQPPHDPSEPHRPSPGAPLGEGVQPPEQLGRRGPGFGAYVITILAFLILTAIIIFIVQNDETLTVKFLGLRHTYRRSSFVLGVSALAGLLVGLLLGLLPWFSTRRKLRDSRRDGKP